MKSIWLTGKKEEIQTNLIGNPMRAEVCIIGAGIFGMSVAYYLTKAGVDVLVVDKDGIARKTTGHTTAKITSQHGLIYHYLLDVYGLDFAKKYFQANEESIDEIEKIVQEKEILCDFERQNHTMYTQSISERKKIEEEVQDLKKITKLAKEVDKTDLPFEIELGVQFQNQAQFHPYEYVQGLAKEVLKEGGKILLDNVCYDLEQEKDGYRIRSKRGDILAKKVILATHYPFIKYPGLYFLKMYQSSSYAIGIDPKAPLFSGMYLQVEEPKHSFRTTIDSNGREILILGGEGHKTGKSVTRQMTYERLEQEAKKYFTNAEVCYWWSTRDCITLDKIPYIGLFSNLLPNVYIGTGFNKWGMTSSNLAARIVSDQILGKENPYQELFTATRMKPIENRDEVKNMLSQSVRTIVGKRMKKSEIGLEDIEEGEGGVIQRNGKKVGVYKDENGKIYAVKPVCTHLGCILNWNGADKTWDCPCHGSRFRYDGENLYDPAIEPLEKIDLEEKEEK